MSVHEHESDSNRGKLRDCRVGQRLAERVSKSAKPAKVTSKIKIEVSKEQLLAALSRFYNVKIPPNAAVGTTRESPVQGADITHVIEWDSTATDHFAFGKTRMFWVVLFCQECRLEKRHTPFQCGMEPEGEGEDRRFTPCIEVEPKWRCPDHPEAGVGVRMVVASHDYAPDPGSRGDEQGRPGMESPK